MVLLEEAQLPDPEILAEACRAFGVSLVPTDDPGPVATDAATTAMHELGGGGLVSAALMPVPYPDWDQVPGGPTSLNHDALGRMTAHLVVVGLGLPELDLIESDARTARITAALALSARALGVQVVEPRGAVFHELQTFAMAAAGDREDAAVVAATCVDMTMDISGSPMSLLTHGLRRYGREEFLLVAPVVDRDRADFLKGMAAWMIGEPDKVLPVGDTIGRTADEKYRVASGPSLIEGDPELIRLTLEETAKSPKKKGWFRR